MASQSLPRTCIHHPERKAHGLGLCSACYTKALRDVNPEQRAANYERVKQWRAKNKDKWREQGVRYREKHAEKIKEYQESWRQENAELYHAQSAAGARKRRRTNPEAQRIRHHRWKQKQELKLIEIAGRERPDRCELCGSKSKTVFDHCHQTGRFRGWLCDRCNRTLGQVKDDTELLHRMIEYLEAGGTDGQTDIKQANRAAGK